ncbi:hypothetical protein A5821_000732 [Enterococcus sp. 7F3_DIV0205]|uniref:N-acetyltransferase domain-containing protein n=1 Tax=Candidatus Enterococcus palustris TaxID=1834189 RepID=A0AAQ3W900_9ENTE|nr:GNAT family N-acetyltransferase [Enterococcus sp. 7F3_DIV0205]OTN85147.1 hypothetical protein A5821_001076 [Enterococcus sp. 7F3_DIV0205]
MILKQTIQKHLEPQEIKDVQVLKETNKKIYSIEYKLDLSFFKKTNEKVDHLLCWEEDVLVGYAALSNFDPEELEVTIIAQPNKKIIDKIQEAIVSFSRQRMIKEILWIIDRKDHFLNSYVKEVSGYKYSFSEYAMILATDQFVLTPSDYAIEPARIEEAKAIAALEYGKSTDEIVPIDQEDLKKTLVLRENGQVIASIRLENEDNSYGIYGFVVRPDYRGQGIGRKIICQLVQQLIDKQATKIYLEVDSTNEAARHLYHSIGFEEQTLFDYYIYTLNR